MFKIKRKIKSKTQIKKSQYKNKIELMHMNS